MTTLTTGPGGPPTEVESEERIAVQRTSKGRLILRRYLRNKLAVVGLVIFLFLVFMAIFGSRFGKYDYSDTDFLSLNKPPGGDHWLGTDGAGGDMYARLIRGLGRSLMIGVIASVAVTIIAAIVGTAIAYFEGWPEKVGTWLLDMCMVIPSFFILAIMTSRASGTNGWILLCAALTLFGWFGYARILRAIALSLRDREYITAAKFMGERSFTIIFRHMIPNLGSILIIHTVLGVVTFIEAETSLSFIGFGITPPDTSLGTQISDGVASMLTAPWLLIEPIVVLLALLFSMTFIGDGLRDALDPSSESGGRA